VSRLLGIALLYLIMLLAWTGVGIFFLVAPGRVGNLLHENLNLFPPVGRGDWGKKLFLRLIGLGLLAFAIRIVLRLLDAAG
jgi:hypothetical protein